jgi:dihydroorotase
MLICNAILCDAFGEKKCDVRIEDNIIQKIEDKIVANEGEKVIDANLRYLLPQIIDTNVSVNSHNLNGKNLEKLSRDAYYGGVKKVVLSPDTLPAINDEITLEFVQKHRYHDKGSIVESSICAINSEGALSNIAILLKDGAVAPFISTDIDTNLLCRISEYIKMYNKTLFCAAQDNALLSTGVMVESALANQMGLGGISPLSEITHVSKMIEIARFYGIKILFKSISTSRAIELIQSAKDEGVSVSCEVSIFHLTNSNLACKEFNTLAKIQPPLNTEDELTYMQKALCDGKIDILTSLHRPHTHVDKEVAFFDASYGSESIRDILPLYFTKLVKTGLISMSKLMELTLKNSAESIGEVDGKIEAGQKADLLLFDTKTSYKVNATLSLYNGEELFGVIENL